MPKRDPSALAYAANVNRAIVDRLMDGISLRKQQEILGISARNIADPEEAAQIESTKDEFFECKRNAICRVRGWAQRKGRIPTEKNYPPELDKEIQKLALCYEYALHISAEEAHMLAKDAKESILLGVADDLRRFGKDDRILHAKPGQLHR